MRSSLLCCVGGEQFGSGGWVQILSRSYTNLERWKLEGFKNSCDKKFAREKQGIVLILGSPEEIGGRLLDTVDETVISSAYGLDLIMW